MSGLSMASLSLYILSYNCGKAAINIEAVASQLFSGLDTPQLPDLLVINLQEIAPLAQAFIGGSFLVPYFSKFHDAVHLATKNFEDGDHTRYTAIAARNLGLTGIMVFAKNTNVVEDVEIAGVGVGDWEMGNKGAVGVRLSYRDISSANDSYTELTFVSAHLAAMEWELQRRNKDWKDIVRGLVFYSSAKDRRRRDTSTGREEERPLLSISPADASIFKPTSHLFFAGDLNYRTSILSPSPEDSKNVFPHPQAETTSPKHYSNLWQHDQLSAERAAGRTCHGLVEAEVTFPPTYKYDEDKQEPLKSDPELSHWHWAPHRWPSWCDRILYLDMPSWMKRERPDIEIGAHKYSALPLFGTSDHRAVAMNFTVPLMPISPPSQEDDASDPRIKPPFDINPNWKSQRDRARTWELIVGFSMYFTTTWEGISVLLATVGGIIGAYFVIRAFVEF